MAILLRRSSKFAPSQNPYWFDRESLRLLRGQHEIDTVWASRKRGRTVVTFGTYTLFTARASQPITDSPISLIEGADTRYGGKWLYRWDGVRFQENPTAPTLPLTQLTQIQKDLSAILVSLPDWPTPSTVGNWSGPYYKTEVPR